MKCSWIGIGWTGLVVWACAALVACAENRTPNLAPNDVSGFQTARKGLKAELAECEEDCNGDLLCINKCRKNYKAKSRKLLNKPSVSPSGAALPPTQ